MCDKSCDQSCDGPGPGDCDGCGEGYEEDGDLVCQGMAQNAGDCSVCNRTEKLKLTAFLYGYGHN